MSTYRFAILLDALSARLTRNCDVRNILTVTSPHTPGPDVRHADGQLVSRQVRQIILDLGQLSFGF